jgi:tRNA-Thr(GGU) m(6)t(6)A37 methyltransferase TsaA
LNGTGRSPTPMSWEPIAMVKNDVKEMGRHDWDKVISQLIFRPDLEDALEGVKEFSHLIVLFVFHLSPSGEDVPHKIHPQKRPDLPLVGVFATRSPVRPNPLGMAVVEIKGQMKNVLMVTGLDALDGTPIVDIKPYLTDDSMDRLRVPDWILKLRESDRK